MHPFTDIFLNIFFPSDIYIYLIKEDNMQLREISFIVYMHAHGDDMKIVRSKDGYVKGVHFSKTVYERGVLSKLYTKG